MIGLRRTYRDVAKEISEGLASGSVVPESESTENEMGLLAGLLFQYLSPRKVAFVVGDSGSMGMIHSSSQVMIQIDPKAYESLPEDVKARFNKKTQELREKGVKIKIKDLKGKPIDMTGIIGITPNAASR